MTERSLNLSSFLEDMEQKEVEKYRNLLMEVADGEGEICGYANLEGKTSEAFRSAVEKYRDRILEKDRVDRFIVPDNTENIDLVKEHFSEQELRQHFKPRFIPENLVDVNCDFYLWDGKVGICSFNEGELEVRMEESQVMYDLYKQFFESLWGIALERNLFYGPRTSKLTDLEKELYLNPDQYLNLAEGYPREVNPDWIEEKRRNLSENFVQEPPRELIEQVREYFKDLMRSDNIIITPSATQSLVLATDAVVETPGDEIIALDPGYDAYPNLARSMGANLIPVKRNGRSISVEKIEKKVSERTVAVAITNPENPLGIIYEKQEVEELAELCIDKDLILLMDSAHMQVSPLGKEVSRLTQIETSDALSFLQVGDTGKILGLEGSKLGCISHSKDMRTELENRKNNYFFQLNKYDLKLVSEIVHDNRFQDFKQDYLRKIKQNYRYLDQNLDEKLEVSEFDGSTACLIDISKTRFKDTELVEKLMEEYNLGMVPVSYFYQLEDSEKHDHIRIALGRPREYIEEATKSINNALSEHAD